MPSETLAAAPDANLGLYDGLVAHGEVNEAIARAEKSVLYGEQTRLPYFPDDERLAKLHAGDPLVLLFWRIFKKVPETLREALLATPFSLTLVRGDGLLFFADCRRHQAVHIGCRRRTIYLPEALLRAAEERGYDYWAIAEGLVFASWMLLDYLLLVDLLAAYATEVAALPGYRLNEALQLKLARTHNRHRRDGAEAGRSEVVEFVEGYRSRLLAVHPAEVAGTDPHALARRLLDPERELRWAREKMERIAQVFNFPELFLFDRDIIHGTAYEEARRRGQRVEAATFGDALHDYRDALRFEPRPLMTVLGRARMPKPRATFLQQTVALGGEGLRGYFAAYREDESQVRELMHPLWAYLCSLSSDPAGVFSRVGRARALTRQALPGDLEELIAGVLIRLDRAPNYPELVEEVAAGGPVARTELESLVARQQLVEDDAWEAFKSRKQRIVARAGEVLERWAGLPEPAGPRSVGLHQDEAVQALLTGSPHRLTSDPSGAQMYLQAYRRSLAEFGPDDPDSSFLLASLLIRLDRSEHYPRFIERLEALGAPTVSALHGVFEQIPERDLRRRPILLQARILWSRMLARQRAQYVRRPG
ncbi:MAG: hypothetical protein WDA75_04210 [Candidatus Latescibacterota bacterium]|jgi:hypothetical protein